MSFSLTPLLCAAAVILVHGAGHLLAARLVGIRAMRLRRSATGLRLLASRPFSSYDAELYCALGGPLCNAASALFCRLVLLPAGIGQAALPSFIALSLYLALLNLLPLRGFDGDRILRCLLLGSRRPRHALSPDTVERIFAAISFAVLILLWLLSVYLLLRRGSALSLYLFCLQLFLGAREEGG